MEQLLNQLRPSRNSSVWQHQPPAEQSRQQFEPFLVENVFIDLNRMRVTDRSQIEKKIGENREKNEKYDKKWGLQGVIDLFGAGGWFDAEGG